jgi:hypothetical protein
MQDGDVHVAGTSLMGKRFVRKGMSSSVDFASWSRGLEV